MAGTHAGWLLDLCCARDCHDARLDSVVHSITTRFTNLGSPTCSAATAPRIEAFEGGLVQFVAFVEVDGAPDVAFEAGVEGSDGSFS